MKKLLWIVVLIFIFSNKPSEAGKTNFRKGSFYSGEVYWTSRIIYELPPGSWEVIDRWGWSVKSVEGKGVTLVKVKDGIVDAIFDIGEVSVNGKWIAALTSWINKIYFRGKYDGCYERPEYYLVKVNRQGSAFNCLKVRHVDLYKLLYNPDDPRTWARTWSSFVRKWLDNSGNEFPKIMLEASHSFFATTVKDSMYEVNYLINPETHQGPKNNFDTEDTSEYHSRNLSNYPQHKKYIDNFVNEAVYEHQKFEYIVRAKTRHLIDFSEYNVEEISKKTTTASGSQLTEQLKELKQLYEDGVLTKEEFTKAKKKLLN